MLGLIALNLPRLHATNTSFNNKLNGEKMLSALSIEDNDTTIHKNLQTVKVEKINGGVVENSSSYQKPLISLKEIINPEKKWKWLDEFSMEYNQIKANRMENFNKVTFYRIDTMNSKGAGFIQVGNTSKEGIGSNNTLIIAYIKPSYRKQSIYSHILTSKVSDLLIDGVFLEPKILFKYRDFFTSLGFVKDIEFRAGRVVTR